MQWIFYRAIDDWRIAFLLLVTWWVIAAFIIWFVHRRWCSKRRAKNPSRYRLIFALVLAIVFTPSVISDFWLFMVPGPAIGEFLFLLPSAFPHPGPFLYVVTVVCLAPIAAAFGMFYLVLWLFDRRRSDVLQTA